jgi:hypothetical protein
MTVDFHNWFDVNNKEHLAAFEHYRISNNWPNNFVIPGYVTLNHEHWYSLVLSKITTRYLELILGK